ncbi:MAG: 5-formyltetrahydrofolate cyclo-ligase [Deltaproteobacteria bacterium]|nr:5-formyltetrahydrofolate cyclo-ligase [Deltaproteobacteria bacterium]MBW1932676.1 5-formyltetrahydrofolate cyclo-ligase [Deltaproteobacteria bacterium]MBW1938596.1 5-formyltetrahydrofolate cyclo-ligase [Deltaproteobacteria bacterium]MBW1964337.1 5-formyltetrahydrofolate cyclo-ligase [Deltaproteobacteria bacterium]MBW2349848.1 5-formyltetrahydrofolate cyclo-ligase [Deltaproteobacteria bacterium]
MSLSGSYRRSQILSKRDCLSFSTVSCLSKIITDNLRGLEEYQTSRIPFIYVSFRSEVDTHQLIIERLISGLEVAIPKTDVTNRRLETYLLRDWGKDLRPGAYGILEPDVKVTSLIRPSQIDMVVVPGSVFDRQCGRYGYGGGYFDRFLSIEAPQALRIGLAFSLQVLPKIPLKTHDQRMDIIVTESEILRCNRKANS